MLRLLRIRGRGGHLTRSAYAPHPLTPADIAAAQDALDHVRSSLAVRPTSSGPVVVTVEDSGECLTLPRAAADLLTRVLAHMAVGQSVTVVPTNAELTTQEAADLLNVSRPFLIGLLTAGEIEHRMVGTHRRVLAESLLRYRAVDDAQRRRHADELTALTQELGLT